MTVCRSSPSAPHYSADIFGRITHHPDHKAPRALPVRLDGRGYACVNMRVGGQRITRKVHHLVAEAFMGPTPAGCHIDHLDGDRLNNRLENLRFRPAGENSAGGRKTSRAGVRPLTEQQKNAVDVLTQAGWRTSDIAIALGIGCTTVRRLKRQPSPTNRSWTP